MYLRWIICVILLRYSLCLPYNYMPNLTCGRWKTMFNRGIDTRVCIWTTITDIYMILFTPGLMSSMSSTILAMNESMSD